MRHSSISVLVTSFLLLAGGSARADWLQRNHDANHAGQVAIAGQEVGAIQQDIVHDNAVPPAPQDLLIHYMDPLVDADGNVYLAYRDRISGNIIYTVKKLDTNGSELWAYTSDYKPPIGAPLSGTTWEPVFGFVVSGGLVYVMGAYGYLHAINANDGSFVADVKSYTYAGDPAGLLNTVAVAAPPMVDGAGNLYYTVRATATNPAGVKNHVVKCDTASVITTANFDVLTGDANQQTALNAVPAVGADGTIYAVSTRRAIAGPPASPSQYNGYVVAINPNMTLKWLGSMRSDPVHEGRVIDSSTASPVIAPDGSIIMGGWNAPHAANATAEPPIPACAASECPVSEGFLNKFSSSGAYMGNFPFGWDTTPGIWPIGDGNYELVEKWNQYTDERFFIVWIDPSDMSLKRSWELITPPPTTPFEMCVSAPAIDSNGYVYADGEDGYIYRIAPDAVNFTRLFLRAPRNAAYTPTSIGNDGRIYTLNDGHLFVLTNAP